MLKTISKESSRARSRAEARYPATGYDLLTRLRCDIVGNVFEPVSKLKFADLTKRYNVGIGTLREALSHLASEGFVTFDAGRGFRVAPVSRNDIEEITAHFVDFEKRALAEAIDHGDDEWETAIVASYHRLSIIEDLPWEMRMERHGDWVERHKEFHSALVGACRSRWLLKLRTLMFDQSERYRFLSKLNPHKKSARGTQHREIMQAALRRDKMLALDLIERHVTETAENVFKHLART